MKPDYGIFNVLYLSRKRISIVTDDRAKYCFLARELIKNGIHHYTSPDDEVIKNNGCGIQFNSLKFSSQFYMDNMVGFRVTGAFNSFGFEPKMDFLYCICKRQEGISADNFVRNSSWR